MQKRHHRIVVKTKHDGLRLDRFLVLNIPDASRATVRRMLLSGAIIVDGRLKKKGDSVRAGEIVEIDVGIAASSAEGWSPKPNPKIKLEILFEDDFMVVVNKPAGLPCHPLLHNETENVASALLARIPELAKLRGARREAGLAHRLDTTTSGVLVFARRNSAFDSLVEQLRRGSEARKIYHALVEGDVFDSGVSSIDFPLMKRGRRMIAVKTTLSRTRKILPARTLVRPLRGLKLKSLADDATRPATLVEITITRGRRHQIRSHLSAVGHPIVGDTLYGAMKTNLARPLLHASLLELRHPSTGDRLRLTAPMAADFEELIEEVLQEKIDEIFEL